MSAGDHGGDGYRLAGPLMRLLPAEAAHGLALWALKAGLAPRQRGPDPPILASRLWDLDFPNPVGLAAGFDKDGEAVAALLALGFGFVEVGSVTPRPQPGNPRPRLFRLPEDEAVINRLGFNSAGHEAVAARLRSLRRPGAERPGVIGVNLGMNRDSAEPAADYAAGVAAFAGLADYLVVNVSSPNTPGLRELQERHALGELLIRVREAGGGASAAGGPPLLLKIAPDLDAAERRDAAQVALEAGVDGLIVSNTTLSRPPGLEGRHRGEAGGLSGRPLMAPSTEALADIYRLTEGRLPLIGTGGIAGGADAYAKIRAGASLVQLYTALVYQGPGLIARIKRELAELLRQGGFANLGEAVGADHR